MKKIKVLTIVGTRPEIIRLSRVMTLLDQHCNHFIIHTGQNYDYELNEIFFTDLELRKPDFFLNIAENSTSLGEVIGKLIIEVDKVLEALNPNAILILGDTNSCLSVIPAKRRKIPIFHMEAGNRCFDLRVPEEINRKIIDHTADVNLPYSNIAREYLLREGLPPDLIIKTGSPMSEVLFHFRHKIEESEILSRLDLKKNNFFLVSIHREENIDPEKSFKKFISMLDHLAKKYNLPIIVSTHPRTQKKIKDKKIKFNKNVRLMKPLGFFDYNKLQISAQATLSDSGTINEESSILNFPALNLRECHERPEAMEEATVIMTGLEIDRIDQALEILKSNNKIKYLLNKNVIVKDYDVLNVSQKIVRIIHSYIDYVNRINWKK